MVIVIGLLVEGYFLAKRYSDDVEQEKINQEKINEVEKDKLMNPKDDSLKENDNVNNDLEVNINENNKNISNSEQNTVKDSNISSKLELKSLGNLQYYLYTPSNPKEGMPLIMYLHGGTNKRATVTELLTADGFPKYLSDGYYGDLRAYVVIPKLDNKYMGWADIATDLRNLIKNINTNYKIDMNKISLTGHSMGGTGTYQLQVKLPNTFCGIAPMSGSIKNTADNINGLSNAKVWAFVGSEDTIVNPNSSREIIAALKEKGVDARITEFLSATHFDVPALGYKNNELINWLVNCSK